MVGTLRFRKQTIFFLFIILFIVIVLIGSILFTHLPRTCIPHVDLKNSWTSPPPPRIVMLSGERCVAKHPESKCRILSDLSLYNRREYIAHHQGRYTLRDNFTAYFEDVVSKGYSPAWAKIRILKEELDRDESDWIFWIDTDALITNMDISLERFLDNRYSLLVTRDQIFLTQACFCSGSTTGHGTTCASCSRGWRKVPTSRTG